MRLRITERPHCLWFHLYMNRKVIVSAVNLFEIFWKKLRIRRYILVVFFLIAVIRVEPSVKYSLVSIKYSLVMCALIMDLLKISLQGFIFIPSFQ